MSNRSFKEGFVDGFTAPFTLFAEKTSDATKYQTSVGRAWGAVGDAFREVMRNEGAIIDKERGKRRQGDKRAA